MQKQQVPVEKLQFGMYVAELDRPWTDTPFMYQGFHLSSPAQLAALKKFCKHVFIDPERTQAPDPATVQPAFKVRGMTTYTEAAQVEIEFKRAQPIFEQTAKSVPDLLQPAAKAGGVLD